MSVYRIGCLFSEKVTQVAKELLDGGQEIPLELLAKVVKFLLLQIKTADQQQRKAEKVS